MRAIVGLVSTGGSLIASFELIRFALAYLVLAVAPGYGLAALLRPHGPRVERVAFAVPCAYAIVTVCGLTTALLRLPFDLWTYAAFAVPATLAAAYTYTAWRAHGQRRAPCDTEQGRWWLIPAGVAVTQLVATALIYLGETMPAGFDVLAHVTWTNAIVQAHIYPIALMSARLGVNNGGFYPPTFHALNALILGVAPMPTYRVVFYSTVAATVVFPLGLYAYVRAATGSARLAGLAALASLAFEPLPFFTVGVGIYPFVVSLVFVPTLAVALRDGFVGGDRRAITLAVLLGAGLFYTHPTEFVTAGLLTLAIVPGRLRGLRVWARAAGYGLLVAVAWFAAAFPALAAVHSTIVNGAQVEVRSTRDFTPPPHVDLPGLLNGYVEWIYGRNLGYLLLAATVIGIAWCLVRRRYLGLVVVQVIVTFLFLDSSSYNIARPFYVLSFPWALLQRLAPTHYWFVLPLAAIGVDVMLRAVHRLTRTRRAPFVALAASPLVVFGLLFPLGIGAVRTGAYARARRVVDPADLGALAWLTRYAAKDTVIVNEGDVKHTNEFDAPSDAGRWIPVVGGPEPLFWRGGVGPGAIGDRYYLLRHIADTPLPPRAARFVAQYHVRYVFYGAIVRVYTRRTLDLPRLLADPSLRLAYTSAPACRSGAAHDPTACPPNGSYVFALRTAGGQYALARAAR